jgi:hypothetical protein
MAELIAHHTGQNIDRGIMVGGCKIPREHDMAVEDRTRFIGHGLGHVVAFDENCIERGDRAAIGLPGTLHQLRQSFEN